MLLFLLLVCQQVITVNLRIFFYSWFLKPNIEILLIIDAAEYFPSVSYLWGHTERASCAGWRVSHYFSDLFKIVCVTHILRNGLRSASAEVKFPSALCLILHLVLQPVSESSKALSPFITFRLLWSYLFATSEPRASWSWISSYNPSQKFISLWHPAGLLSPRNLRPQFPEFRFDVWSSLSASPTRPVDIKCFLFFIFSTCDHVFLL